MGAWIWYLLVAVLAWAFKLPTLVPVATALTLLVLRLPGPDVLVTRFVRERELRARTRAYPGDLLARRNLARSLVERGAHREARAVLEEAIAKGLDDDEAFYLLGCARLGARDDEGALEPLVRCVRVHERFLFGEPYKRAADALAHLGRFDEADDALERAIAVNSSDLDARVALGRVRWSKGDRAGARTAWGEAWRVWGELPDYLRWKALPRALEARLLSSWHRR